MQPARPPRQQASPSQAAPLLAMAMALLIAAPPAAAQQSAARQAQILNRAVCADIVAGLPQPAECHADIARQQLALVPTEAKTGTASLAAAAALAHRAALVAGQRGLPLQVQVELSRQGLDSVTLDLDQPAVAELSRIDSAKAAETLVRRQGRRCQNRLLESKCGPLPAK